MLTRLNVPESEYLNLIQQRGIVTGGLSRGFIDKIGTAGELHVAVMPELSLVCDVLIVGNNLTYSVGDDVLVHVPTMGNGRGIVLGQVGRVVVPAPPPTRLVFEAAESLSLKCGNASIDVRADGKVLIKGEDITVHAKGTQRIRAGTVSIN